MQTDLDQHWWFGGGGEGGGEGGDADADPSASSPLGLLSQLSFGGVQWAVVLSALPYSLSCCLVHSLVTITDLVSVEAVATARPASRQGETERPPPAAASFDLDRELSSIGMANLFAACVGTIPNYVQLSPSVANMSLSRGLRGRARAGPWVVLFAACSTLVVSDVAASVPRAVVGAYMAHMGIGFMGEGLETIRRTNDTVDKLLVVVVPLLMACNFLSGLLFGLIVSLIKFVIIYSRAPIVRVHTDGLQSNTVRPWMHRTFLLEYGAANIHIVSVHGFLMFGSSPQLSRAVAAVAEAHSDTTSGATAKGEASSADGLAEGCGGDEAAPPVPVMPPWFVILDLAACKGCDFGAVQELIKLSETVADRGGALRLTLPPAHVQAALESGSRGLLGQLEGLQQTLCECEDAIIAACAPGGFRRRSLPTVVPSGGNSTRDHETLLCAWYQDTLLEPHSQPTDAQVELAATLLRLGERQEVAPREVVWREESQAGFFGYVLDGELELLHCGTKIELLVPGSTFGFLFMICGAYTGGKRETTLVGKSPRGSTLLLISEETWAGLRHTHPELERLMKDGMLRRVAHEYHAFVRHHEHRGTPEGTLRGGLVPRQTRQRIGRVS